MIIFFWIIPRNEINIDLNHFSIDSYCGMVMVKLHFFPILITFSVFVRNIKCREREKRFKTLFHFIFSMQVEMLVIILVSRNRIKASTNRPTTLSKDFLFLALIWSWCNSNRLGILCYIKRDSIWGWSEERVSICKRESHIHEENEGEKEKWREKTGRF